MVACDSGIICIFTKKLKKKKERKRNSHISVNDSSGIQMIYRFALHLQYIRLNCSFCVEIAERSEISAGLRLKDLVCRHLEQKFSKKILLHDFNPTSLTWKEGKHKLNF